MSKQPHISSEYPYRAKVTDPYQALATAVLKNAIGIWKNGNISEKSKVQKWLSTKGYVKSYEFWCTAAGIEMDWLREQLNKYERYKVLGKKKSELEVSLDTRKRPYKRK